MNIVKDLKSPFPPPALGNFRNGSITEEDTVEYVLLVEFY